MPSPKRGRAPLREASPSLFPFNARRALNEYENILSSLYWCVAFLQEDSVGDAANLWDCAKRSGARFSNRLQNGDLERLDIETRGIPSIENLYDWFCGVRDAFELAAPDFPRGMRSRKRKLPMTCFELVERRRALTDIGYYFGLMRLVDEDTTFTDEPAAADLGFPLIIPELFPRSCVEDAIFLRDWNLSGKKCDYEPTTAEDLLKTGRFRFGLSGHGWPVEWLYAVCKNCGHIVGTDLVVKGTLETVYRRCDEGRQEPDANATGQLPRPVYSRPYSPKELTDKFNRTWKVIKGWIDSGQLRAITFNSKNYRIHLEDDPDNV